MRGTSLRRFALGVSFALASLPAIAAAPAAAATRYTTPSPGGGADCSQAKPCGFAQGISGLNDGDEVVVGPGTYGPLSGLLPVSAAARIHGAAGQPRPVIRLTTASQFESGLSIGGPATIADLELRVTGPGHGLLLYREAFGERLIVRSQGVTACGLGEASLRDSICQGVAGGTDGLQLTSGAEPGVVALVNNVTAVSGATLVEGEDAVEVFANDSEPDEVILLGNNLIAHGYDADVRVRTAHGESLAGALLGNSNFSTVVTEGPGDEIPAYPDTAGNTTGEPGFLDPLPLEPFTADFHQLPDSPTIDAGGPGSLVAAVDIDGEPRCMGGQIDVGADEHPGPVCPTGSAADGSGTPPPPPAPRPTCRGKPATIVARGSRTVGTRRADVIVGTNGPDTIIAGRGNDTVCGRGGRDTIAGNAGRDTLVGGPGPDVIHGGGGPDLLIGGPGRDAMQGGGGNDVLRGGPGRDSLSGGPGRDRLRPGPGQGRRRARR